MNTPTRISLVALTLVALLTGGTSHAADWNQWRGPNRDGIATSFQVPAQWKPDSLAKQWTITVGEGHSSPVVAGDRVYVFARENDQEILRCVSLADGKVLWKEAYAAPYEMNMAARGHGKGPKATPTVVDGRVFTLGINGHVSAHDAKTGAVLWRKDFAREYKSTAPAFGAAASPLVAGSQMILHVGGRNSGALTSFDVATGQVRWRWTGDGPAYTSPVLATIGGIQQIITQSQQHCVALSPADGKVLWQLPFTTPYDQNIVTPIVAGDLVIFGGIQKPTFAIKVTGGQPATAWETREITMYMSSPVLNGTTLHGMSDKQRGMLFSLDVTSGEVLWRSEGRLGANASITDVGPALLVVTESGELSVRKKEGVALTEVIKYKIADSPVWASPALTRNQILIKDQTRLILYRVGG